MNTRTITIALFSFLKAMNTLHTCLAMVRSVSTDREHATKNRVSHTIICLQENVCRESLAQEKRKKEDVKPPEVKALSVPDDGLELPFMCTIRPSQTRMLVECTAPP